MALQMDPVHVLASRRAWTESVRRNVNFWTVLDRRLLPELPIPAPVQINSPDWVEGNPGLGEAKGGDRGNITQINSFFRHRRNQLPHPVIAATAVLKCIKQPEAKTLINSSVKAEMFFSNGSLNTNNHSSLMCTWLWLTFFWHFLTSPSQVLIWN